MRPKDRSLLKRLWWVLSVRDAFCASLVGRPLRIDTDHSDVEMLTMKDFEHDVPSFDISEHHLQEVYGQYQIEVAKLSLILHQIIYARWVPGRRKSPISILHDSLQIWRQELHPSVDWSTCDGNLLASCLSILYDHHIILANLGSSDFNSMAGVNGNAANTPQRLQEASAQRISALFSSIVVKSQSLLMSHETFQGIFLAGVVSYTQMRSSQPMLSQIGRSTIDNCKMVLHNVYEAWDPSPWVIDLFDKLSTNLPKSPSSAGREARSSNADQLPIADFPDLANGFGFDFGSAWQSNPMLSSLFDFSADVANFDYQIDGPSAPDFNH